MKLANKLLCALTVPLLFLAPACDGDDEDDDMMEAGETGSGGGGTTDGSSTGGGSTTEGGSTTGGSTTDDGTTDGSTTDGGTTEGSDSDLGQKCEFAEECEGNVCLFNPGDDFGFCSKVCVDWTECPDFWDCIELSNASYSACVPD